MCWTIPWSEAGPPPPPWEHFWSRVARCKANGNRSRPWSNCASFWSSPCQFPEIFPWGWIQLHIPGGPSTILPFPKHSLEVDGMWVWTPCPPPNKFKWLLPYPKQLWCWHQTLADLLRKWSGSCWLRENSVLHIGIQYILYIYIVLPKLLCV